jgi:nitric oxide reductase NorD protein
VRGRIAALDAGESTRLGAALRHATARLAREPSRLRLLLLLSDGRPNDRDEYEGAHGLEDTRQAVAEARLQGVQVFCLTVDRKAPAYLPHLFGPAGYLLVPRIAALPARMVDVYRRLTRGR